jgi:SAM-dependent methyltransferase
MHRFIQADLSVGLPALEQEFDVVLAADVIEHLPDPGRLLADFEHVVRPGGSIIASVPNVGHWYPRGRVAVGRFDYDQRGILDSTHLRFFTQRSFLRLAKTAGLEPVRRLHTGLPLDALGLGERPMVAGTLGRADLAMVRLWPTMFAYQFVFEFVPWRGGALRPDSSPTS